MQKWRVIVVDKSESIKNLAMAMCKAQAEMGGAVKNGLNPHFKNKFANLESVIAAIKTPFSSNGLSYVQFPIEDKGRIGVETILMHESGEYISNSFTVNLNKQDAQQAGSALTYCRRYGLQAVAGIPSEDDDGNSASDGFDLDDNAKGWIANAKADKGILSQITDPKYRKFIEGNL